MERSAPSRILVDRYVEALVHGDETGSGRMIQDALTAGWTLAGIYSHMLTPAHARIDRLCFEGEINRAHQHLARQITLSHVERFCSRLPAHRRHGHRVMVAVVAKGEHSLEALMMSDVFRSDGWTVDSIGSALPLKDLIQLLQERKPELLAIPSTSGIKPQMLRRLAKVVQGLQPPPPIILGGGALEQGSTSAFEVDGVRVAADLEAVLRIGRELLAPHGAESGLIDFLTTLGGRIRVARRHQSLTQQQLAERAGLDRTYIVAVEQGRQNLTVGAVMRIAEALNVPMDQLFVSEKINKDDTRGSFDRDHSSIDSRSGK